MLVPSTPRFTFLLLYLRQCTILCVCVSPSVYLLIYIPLCYMCVHLRVCIVAAAPVLLLLYDWKCVCLCGFCHWLSSCVFARPAPPTFAIVNDLWRFFLSLCFIACPASSSVVLLLSFLQCPPILSTSCSFLEFLP